MVQLEFFDEADAVLVMRHCLAHNLLCKLNLTCLFELGVGHSFGEIIKLFELGQSVEDSTPIVLAKREWIAF